MSAQIPTPDALAQRFATALAQQQFTASDGTVVHLDATAPATLESALAILSALADYEIYLYMHDQLLELMVDKATVTPGTGLLPRHAEIWGVPRTPPAAAVGNFLITARPGQDVTLPAGTRVTVDGSAQWVSGSSVTVPAGTAVPVAAVADQTGISGNLGGGLAAGLVTPVAGIVSVVSDANGMAGGTEIEPVESWRGRILDEIRNPPSGGSPSDYSKWARQAGAAYVKVLPLWLGLGTVGVIVAMSGGITATPAQVAAIQSYIDVRRPVRGNVTVAAAVIVPQTVTVVLNPNTAAAQAAITAALQAYYLSQGIGATIYAEAVNARIAAVAGDRNTLLVPALDQTFGPTQFPVFGGAVWKTPGASP